MYQVNIKEIIKINIHNIDDSITFIITYIKNKQIQNSNILFILIIMKNNVLIYVFFIVQIYNFRQ